MDGCGDFAFQSGGQKSSSFWVDDWVEVGPLFLSFPRLFMMVVNKWALIKECCMGEGVFGPRNVSFRRGLRQYEESEFGLLVSLLSDIFICRDVANSCIWKTSRSGGFSCKSFSRE